MSPSMEKTPSVAIKARWCRGRSSVEQHPHVAHVGVAEGNHGRAGEARAGPQAGMREFIDEHEVADARPAPE